MLESHGNSNIIILERRSSFNEDKIKELEELNK